MTMMPVSVQSIVILCELRADLWKVATSIILLNKQLCSKAWNLFVVLNRVDVFIWIRKLPTKFLLSISHVWMGICMKVGKWCITVKNHPSFAAWSWYGKKSSHLFSWQLCLSNAWTFPSQCLLAKLCSLKKTSSATRPMKIWLAASNTQPKRCVPSLQRWRTLWDCPYRRGLDMQESCVWLMMSPPRNWE